MARLEIVDYDSFGVDELHIATEWRVVSDDIDYSPTPIVLFEHIEYTVNNTSINAILKNPDDSTFDIDYKSKITARMHFGNYITPWLDGTYSCRDNFDV